MKKAKRNPRSSVQPLPASEKELPAYHPGPNQSCSFVLKLWIEDISPDNPEIIWRGHITEVISRKGRHVKSLDEINTYLIHQLQEMGGKKILI